MACSRALCSQSDHVCTRMPFSTYFWSRGAAGCWTSSVSATRVLVCLEAMKAVSEGACLSASNVYWAVAPRSSALDSTGGGYGTCAMFAYGRAFRIPVPKSTGGSGREMIYARSLGSGFGEAGVIATEVGRVKA